MSFQADRRFLISGLVMLLVGLLAPIYSPYALAQIGLLQASDWSCAGLNLFLLCMDVADAFFATG